MQTVLRVIFIYIALLVGLRIIGKRQFSELTAFDIVTLILIPDIVAQGIIRSDYSMTNAIIAVFTLFVLSFLNSLVVQKSKKAEKFVEGQPVVLVHDGEMFETSMNKEHVTPSDVFSQMQKVGLERLKDVKWAILETSGKIAIIPQDGLTFTAVAGEGGKRAVE